MGTVANSLVNTIQSTEKVADQHTEALYQSRYLKVGENTVQGLVYVVSPLQSQENSFNADNSYERG